VRGVALFCDGSVAVTSNILCLCLPTERAPDGPARRDAVPDEVLAVRLGRGLAAHGGRGDQVGDPATFFVNRASRDFHLASGSSAKNSAESSFPVAEDSDGNPRPAPIGSRPDIGCFEAP